MKIFGIEFPEVTTKKKQIKDTLLSEGKDKAIDKYLELCKGHKLTDAIRYVDRVAAKPN